MFKAHKSLVTVVAVCAALLTVGAVHAQQESKEYLVKAAFLYNFAKLIEWPDNRFDDNEAPIEFCIVGRNPFGEALTALGEKELKGRRIKITKLSETSANDQCHLAFLSFDDENKRNESLAAIGNLPIVTVSDSPGFVSSGGYY